MLGIFRVEQGRKVVVGQSMFVQAIHLMVRDHVYNDPEGDAGSVDLLDALVDLGYHDQVTIERSKVIGLHDKVQFV